MLLLLSSLPAWGASCVLGVTYGMLHVVGPDHLGTVLALSVPVSPSQAFYVGSLWSLGHCVGMVVVAILVLCMQKLVNLDLQKWEMVGDYIIGVSMVVCGLYFIARESDYLDEHADGSASLKACCCHEPARRHIHRDLPAGQHRTASTRASRGKLGLCSQYQSGQCAASSKAAVLLGGGGKGAANSQSANPGAEEEAREQEPLLAAARGEDASHSCSRAFSAHNLRGIALGVIQGMCCPMGLMGIVFLTNLPPVGVGCFLIVFLLVSALGTGVMASLMSWAVNNNAMKQTVSNRVLYRVSCCFTLLLGLTWIVANYFGAIHSLNYAEHASPLSMEMNRA